MKIIYGQMTLCQEPESPKNFSVSMKKRVQSDDLIRSQQPLVSDRGNEKYSLSFSLEKAHKTVFAAEEALFRFMREISDESPAALEIRFEQAGRIKHIRFENSVLVKCAAEMDGRITVHALEFACGRKEEP